MEEGRVLERDFFILSDGYALIGATYGNSSSQLSSSVRSLKCWYFDKNFVWQRTVDLVNLTFSYITLGCQITAVTRQN